MNITISNQCKRINLGGQDIDGKIMNYVYKEYTKSPEGEIFSEKHVVFSKNYLRKNLREKCRVAKENLSFSVPEVNIHVKGESFSNKILMYLF